MVALKRLIWLVVAVGMLLIANAINNQLKDYWQDVIQQCGFAIILAVSLNIVNGLTGQFAIGHAGFMSVGAYTGASLTYLVAQRMPHHALTGLGWLVAAMLIGGLCAALAGYIVGVPSLRLRGDYLAIVTLGFGEIIRVLLENTSDLSTLFNNGFAALWKLFGSSTPPTVDLDYMGGATAFQDIPQLTNFLILFGTVVLVIVLSRNLKFSAHGLAFLSIREDEIAADAMGVNTTRIKVTAFVLSAFLAGVGGVLFAHARLTKPDVFNFTLSMNYVVMIVLGGTGSITGATLAAVALTVLPEGLKPIRDRIHFTDEYLQVIYALILVLMMILRPAGVFGTGEIAPLAWFRRMMQARRAPGETGSEIPEAGAPIPSSPPATESEGQPGERRVLLDIVDLTRRFGGLVAVGDVNIRMEQGELIGLIGPNGAGKTTLFNLLTGVYEPSSGRLDFDGKPLAGERPYTLQQRGMRLTWDALLAALGGWVLGSIISTTLVPYVASPADSRLQNTILWCVVLITLGISLATAPRRRRNHPGLRPFQFAQRGISRTFQNIRLFGELTVLENVRIGTYLRRRTHLFDALFRTGRMDREEAENIARARELLARFNLARVENEQAKNLPYGDQRRLEIVRALATQPKLLLLDEPAAGMNPQEKQNLMGLIRQVRDDFGLTILLIEHDMRLVMGICERIYVLDYGRIIAEGTPQEIRSNPKVIAAYLGEELGDADGDGIPDGEETQVGSQERGA
ncbi:MAG TPA: branched-chain amino acid ABC transporter ATP-binding protein/permease [Chthonomonadaceae bacterium]|nr:branched-chain amino acid ABC transporter ATP-binding protein/permease [Chthonomonadaceae bacterium]